MLHQISISYCKPMSYAIGHQPLRARDKISNHLHEPEPSGEASILPDGQQIPSLLWN
jgi:hypothetical protein